MQKRFMLYVREDFIEEETSLLSALSFSLDRESRAKLVLVLFHSIARESLLK